MRSIGRTSGPTLDSLDLKILYLLQQNSGSSQAELGLKINLSAAAVNRRLKRLSEGGIIQRYTAIIAPERLGYPLTVVVQVETNEESISSLQRMKKTFVKSLQVQQCYYVTGEWDFILVLVVRDMAQYEELTRTLFSNNNVKRFKSLVALERVKVGLEIPTDILPPS